MRARKELASDRMVARMERGMEVFSVFATLSLSDLLSGPLANIRSAMRGAEGGANSLGACMGNLTMAMAPVAVAAAVVVGALALCTSSAMAFESAMADVAKVVNFDGPAEFQAMSQQVKELAGRIPMAADGIAAIIASAAQSGVAKQDLAEFAEQAAKMGVAFDLTGDLAGKMMADWRAGMGLSLPQTYALADAVNHLSNSMNATAPALGEVIQRVGAAAMACGLAETQVAALGAAFLSAGASPEIAATALKSFTTTLVKGTAMSKVQAAAFQSIGFSATQMAKDMQTDAQGTIFKVLQAIADKPKELQMSLLTEMFGQESIGAIAPLLKNMGNLTQAFGLVGDAANYAGSMQAEFDARSKTAQNALVLLTNKLKNLAISVGTVFLPFVSKAAAALGILVDAVRVVVDSPFGQWFIRIAGTISAVVLAITAFSASMWALSGLGALVVKSLMPLKAMLLGISWPIWALIAAGAALYAAYKSNFGGIADIVDGWGNTISLVVRGVQAVFASLSGSAGEIRGELAKDIQAAGLVGLVTTVSRVVFRIREFFKGIWNGLNIGGAVSALTPAILLVRDLFSSVGQVVGKLFCGSLAVAGSEAQSLGQIVGMGLSWALEAMATVLVNVVRGVDTVVSMFRWLAAVINGDWATAGAMAQRIWDNLCASFMSIADLFRVGDWMRSAWEDAVNWLSSINLYDAGAALMATLGQGIAGAAVNLYASMRESLGPLGKLLPHSDAEEGPLSSLTLSGARIMSTMGEGVTGEAGVLQDAVSGALSGVQSTLGGWWGGLFGEVPEVNVPTVEGLAIPEAPAFASAPDTDDPRPSQRRAGGQPTTITIHIGSITLPDVANGQDFISSLQGLVAEYGGASA